ncbi:MAG: trehalose-6-phosphate synthase [Chlamydiales bacterium]|nr:trehalose-6-phosphate synthase [Chlamydiales bacterium]
MNQQDALERLVVVSNRLPVVLSRKEGRLAIKKGTGGLITALAPIMRERGGVWVGWPGTVDLTHEEINELAAKFREESGFDLFPVLLSREEVSLYYEGFSNEVIWPLFHDLHFKCHFKPVYWEAYQRVNRRFSEQIVRMIQPQDFLWVHDYHFLLLAQELRKQGINQKLVFFLHIPFAPPDIFMKIPWRQEILSAVLEYDYLGFQTERDKLNFLNCVETLMPNVSIKSYGNYSICHTDSRHVHVGAYPISIDFHEFSDESASKEVANVALQIHMMEDDRKLVFSVDRLDYTKGIYLQVGSDP